MNVKVDMNASSIKSGLKFAQAKSLAFLGWYKNSKKPSTYVSEVRRIPAILNP